MTLLYTREFLQELTEKKDSVQLNTMFDLCEQKNCLNENLWRTDLQSQAYILTLAENKMIGVLNRFKYYAGLENEIKASVNKSGKNLIHLALEDNSQELFKCLKSIIVESLNSEPSLLIIMTADNKTPLQLAIEANNLEAVELLIKEYLKHAESISLEEMFKGSLRLSENKPEIKALLIKHGASLLDINSNAEIEKQPEPFNDPVNFRRAVSDGGLFTNKSYWESVLIERIDAIKNTEEVTGLSAMLFLLRNNDYTPPSATADLETLSELITLLSILDSNLKNEIKNYDTTGCNPVRKINRSCLEYNPDREPRAFITSTIMFASMMLAYVYWCIYNVQLNNDRLNKYHDIKDCYPEFDDTYLLMHCDRSELFLKYNKFDNPANTTRCENVAPLEELYSSCHGLAVAVGFSSTALAFVGLFLLCYLNGLQCVATEDDDDSDAHPCSNLNHLNSSILKSPSYLLEYLMGAYDPQNVIKSKTKELGVVRELSTIITQYHSGTQLATSLETHLRKLTSKDELILTIAVLTQALVQYSTRVKYLPVESRMNLEGLKQLNLKLSGLLNVQMMDTLEAGTTQKSTALYALNGRGVMENTDTLPLLTDGADNDAGMGLPPPI